MICYNKGYNKGYKGYKGFITNELKSYLNKRGYNLSFLNQEIERVHNITRTNALNPKDTPTTNQPERVPLVITYHPALRHVSCT